MARVTTMMPSRVLAIPLEQIQPHPKLAFRFSYEITSLADSIRSAADEGVPNGQLNPGRVVRRMEGDGYYVYVGIRRFLALKMLHDETKDQRFGEYYAYVDENLSLFQMFAEAKVENEEERGERQGLSVLEQASGILMIKDSVKPDELDGNLKRLLNVAEKLGGERLKKLYDVERASRSKFRLSQLESLSRVEEEKEFYTTAAFVAAFGLDDVDAAVKSRNAAYYLQWFPKVFPDYTREEPAPNQKTNDKSTAASPRLEVHEEGVLIADCPRCGGGNMLQIKGKINVNHLSPDPKGKSGTMVADNVSRVACTCSHCERGFYVFARHLEGGQYTIASSPYERLLDPDTKVETVELRFDFDGKVWQKIADGRIVGELNLAPSRPGQ